MPTKKKLIEVALPLEAINKASAREKSIRHGHPSTLHLWWARRPLAAARAVIFAQMVDDPSTYVDVLRSDAKIKRKAESLVKARRKTWLDAKALVERAVGTTANVPEPGPEPTLDEALADVERERLFRIIEDLVQWENTTNEEVLQRARDEIWQSWRRTCAENADHPRAKELFDRNKLPAFHDPFAGGGALPLEAQRLGLESYASDLNPVAVLINKAMIEIPPKFTGRPPVNPESVGAPSGAKLAANAAPTLFAKEWKGAQGLAEDVRYYGQWMRDEAEKRIGHLYPKIEITRAMVDDPANPRPDLEPYVGRKLTVIAWLWARTVKSPNPAFADVDVPLASTFMLSTKHGREAWVEPVIEDRGYRFTVRTVRGPPRADGVAGRRPALGPKDRAEGGAPTDEERIAAAKNGTKLARGANFQCVMSGTPIASDHIYGEAQAGRMGARLMAIVAEGDRGRVYLAPTLEHEAVALAAKPEWKPEVAMPENPRWFSPPLYGLKTFGDLFTDRQLVVLTTFSDLVREAMGLVHRDALATGMASDGNALRDGGIGATGYASALAVYLAFALSKASTRNCTQTAWYTDRDSTMAGFSRQAIPMTWDFAEVNPLLEATGSLAATASWVAEVLDGALSIGGLMSRSFQLDAAQIATTLPPVFSTDPPYYDNIGYADLSDFFYVWLRRSLRPVYPELFATLAVPKTEELVATPYRHGGRESAEAFFLNGMTRVMHRLAEQSHPGFPVTIYYAFKQSERKSEAGSASTGWETFLDAVIRAGLSISGTWPTRTEQPHGLRVINTNALASSIVLVCRPRVGDAPTTTRREFVAALKAELPLALAHLQRGNIAPVDLAQAAIGPGMAVYTRYEKVVDAEGKPLSVREALALINQTLDEALAEQEGDFDADTRWALAWFEQSAFDEGEFGVAEVLSKAKVTSVAGMVDAGILASNRGKVRLLRPEELRDDWDPSTDARLTVWEMVHHLVRALDRGEAAAAELVGQLGSKADTARELAYRLYTLCERKKRAAEALSYNALVQSWPELVRLARETASATPAQGELL